MNLARSCVETPFRSGELALRVTPAVTRLTVYRWLHIMVEREFRGGVGSNKCMTVGCFKHDVLMIQPSDHHKNLVEPSLYAKEGFLKAW